jgi:hypothetical protein
MSLGTFAPETAYDHTWQYEPGAEAGTYTNREADGTDIGSAINCHALRLDIGTRDWMHIAEAMGLTAPKTIWKLWPAAEGSSPPEIDDQLTVDGIKWIIEDRIERHFGARYIIATVEASRQ